MFLRANRNQYSAFTTDAAASETRRGAIYRRQDTTQLDKLLKLEKLKA
jgi:hypothetical protein